MVTILPPAYNSGSQLGSALGQGIQSGMQNQTEYNLQRYRTEQGLNLAQKAAKQAMGGEIDPATGQAKPTDPIGLAFALMRAGSYSPQLERSLGPMTSELFKYINTAQQGNALQDATKPSPLAPAHGQDQKTTPEPSSGTGPVMAGPAGSQTKGPVAQQPPPGQNIPGAASVRPPSPVSKQTARQVDETANTYLQQMRPDLVNAQSQFGKIPTFDYPMQSDLRPEEEGSVRNELRGKYTPAVVDQTVQRLRENIQTRFKENQTAYDYMKDNQKEIGEKWKQVQDNATGQNGLLTPYIQKYENMTDTQDLLKSKYFQYAQNQPVNLTPQAIHANAMVSLQRDLEMLDSLKAIPSMAPIRGTSDMSSRMKSLQEAYKPLVESGWGKAAREDAIMNKDMGNEEFHTAMWGNQTDKGILNKLHQVKYPYHEKALNYRDYPEMRNEYVDKVSKLLNGISQEDDLVMLRAMTLDNGGDPADFTDALQEAVKNGLKLSPFQQSQISELYIPRMKPMDQIFSGDYWKNFINYMRGKK